jgi:hypothetical protein
LNRAVVRIIKDHEKKINVSAGQEAKFLPRQLTIDKGNEIIGISSEKEDLEFSFGECEAHLERLIYEKCDYRTKWKSEIKDQTYALRIVINKLMELDFILVDRSIDSLKSLIEQINVTKMKSLSNVSLENEQTDLKIEERTISFAQPFKNHKTIVTIYLIMFILVGVYNIVLQVMDTGEFAPYGISGSNLVLIYYLVLIGFIYVFVWPYMRLRKRQSELVKIKSDKNEILYEEGLKKTKMIHLNWKELKGFAYHISIFQSAQEELCVLTREQYASYYSKKLWNSSGLDKSGEITISIISLKKYLISKFSKSSIRGIWRNIQAILKQEGGIKETYLMTLPTGFLSPMTNLKMCYWLNKQKQDS